MNQISKELKDEITNRVYAQAKGNNQGIEEKAQTKFRAKVQKIARLRRELDSEVKILSDELKKENLCLRHVDDPDEIGIELYIDNYREISERVISKVIIELQYMKDPNFLNSVDRLISENLKIEKGQELEAIT